VSQVSPEVPQTPEVDTPAEAASPPRRGTAWAGWLVLACYLAAAFVITARLWAHPAVRIQAAGGFSDRPDVDLFAWFLWDEATALGHGKLPGLISMAMNAPHGISMLWNTSLLLPGVLLSPVTLLDGPQVSLTLLLTLGFAGSALSLYGVLRRWETGRVAAALGGAVYGFSPALTDAGIGHSNLQFAVLPPLIVSALMRLVTGRGRPVPTGLWLGLLVAAQLLTGEELLADTALASLVLVVAAAACCPRAIPARAGGTALGLATAAAVTLAACGRILWLQFRGPLRQHGSPWDLGAFYAHPADLVTPPGSLLFHTAASAAAALADQRTTLVEYLAYLGLPLLVVLVAAVLGYGRDPRIRVLAVTCVLLELCTFGGQHAWLPWHYLRQLPLLGQIVTERLAILADGAAAGVLALALDRARGGAGRVAWRARLATGGAVLAVLPLVPLPYQALPVPPVPAGWQAALARLHRPAGAPVLTVPLPYQGNTDAMRWQAETGVPQALVGGYFIGPGPSGQAQEYGTFAIGAARTLDTVWAGDHRGPVNVTQLRATIRSWGAAAVIAVAAPDSPTGRLMTRLLGPPTFQAGQVLAWQRASAVLVLGHPSARPPLGRRLRPRRPEPPGGPRPAA